MKIKIFILSSILYVSCCLTGFMLPAHASVDEGRALLFNGGNPTYSGIQAAHVQFKAAVEANPTDPQANLFYGVTRVLVSVLEQGSGGGYETMGDLLKAFGVTRNTVDAVDDGSPFDDPPHIYDHYAPPEEMPGGEDLRAFLAGPFAALLDGAIANLDKVGSAFTTVLKTEETGDDAVEIDFGDVLLLKSSLHMLKAIILISAAYNLDVDLRELAILGNAGVIQFHRDLLDKYPDLLRLRTTDGIALLAGAKQALLAGIDAFGAAFDCITAESDPQEDDLFYFDSEGKREAQFFLTELTELKNSLTGNRVAAFTTILETWRLTDTATGNRLHTEIEKDVNGEFVGGDYWGMNGCTFISCSGWIEDIAVSGTSITIEVAYGGFFSGSAIFTGTFIDGTQISGTYTEYDGIGSPIGSSSFTGERIGSEQETIQIDFNRVFGNTGKYPLDIRAVMPEFDQWGEGEPVAGTFPPIDDSSPVLNGIFPDIQTNDDLTVEFELQPAGEFLIPGASINVQDNTVNDWAGMTPAFVDITGDDEGEFSGGDIAALYLAQDADYLYVRMTLTEPPNTTAPDVFGGSMHYFVQLAASRYASDWSDRYFGVKYNSGNWEVFVHQYGGSYVIGSHPTGFAQAVGNDLEWKVPLSELDTPFTGYYLNTWSHWTPGPYDCSDSNQTGLRVGPLASISGTVSCNACNGSGNIFVWACDGPNLRHAQQVGSAVVDSQGNYRIENLPAGASVYLFGRWDADNNGIRTFGDYVGRHITAVTVAEGGTGGVDFSLDTEIDNSFIMTKPGRYRVFGSTTYTIPPYYYGSWDPNEVDWGSGWTFIGESNKTAIFNTTHYYKTILIIWGEASIFNFDAFEDLTAGTAFAVNADGTPCGYSWQSSGLKNSDTEQRTEPSYFKGHPDGLYARTEDWCGFSLFTMPDDDIDNNAPRKLKITLLSDLTGDIDGDMILNLSDAILVLKLAAGLGPDVVNVNADVNKDGKIGLAEVVYLLQHVAGLRMDED